MQYKKFLGQITPIWKRHGMSVVARMVVVDGVTALNFTPPQEITILRAETREGFRAYISDPAYQAIKHLRFDALDNFVVLEGKAISTERIEFIDRNPMVVVVLDTNNNKGKDGVDISISLAGQVKGPVAKFLQAVKRVHLYPLSFDDSPAQYGDPSANAAYFVGERLN